jgi:hypothetical protein
MNQETMGLHPRKNLLVLLSWTSLPSEL